MSDRRERVAKAIEEADRRFWQNRIQGGITYFPLLADAALAVIDAEPTDDEVMSIYRGLLSQDIYVSPTDVRYVLLAARKARS